MASSPNSSGAYSLAFTAASLRPELARVVAQAYLDVGDWQEAKRQVLDSNAIQARNPSSGVRMEREMRQRLQMLTPRQIELAASGTADVRAAVAWLSVLRMYAFIFSFAARILRGKMEAHDMVLRPSDYEDFIAAEAIAHPELTAYTPTTKAKLRSVLIKMLREVGILGEGQKDFALRRATLPHDALEAILADDRSWLAGFLVPDAEIAAMGL